MWSWKLQLTSLLYTTRACTEVAAGELGASNSPGGGTNSECTAQTVGELGSPTRAARHRTLTIRWLSAWLGRSHCGPGPVSTEVNQSADYHLWPSHCTGDLNQWDLWLGTVSRLLAPALTINWLSACPRLHWDYFKHPVGSWGPSDNQVIIRLAGTTGTHLSTCWCRGCSGLWSWTPLYWDNLDLIPNPNNYTSCCAHVAQQEVRLLGWDQISLSC